MQLSVLFPSLFVGALLAAMPAFAQQKRWVGTWACAPYIVEEKNMPPAPGLADNSLRQFFRVSIGGDTLRVRFSNVNNQSATTLQAVNVAVSKGGSAIDVATLKALTFDGSPSVTMAAGRDTASDAFAFALEPNMRLTVSIRYGQTSSNMTGHVASRTDSYLASGDRIAAADFNGSTITAHWYSIYAVEVWAAEPAGAVAVIGNSITDGYGLTDGSQNRWPDKFSEKLLADEATMRVGVLNLGIGATTVLGNGPTTGVSRFAHDVLGQSGLGWVVFLYGVNDINAGSSAQAITGGLRQMAEAAKARGLKVYGGTLTPFKGNSYFSADNERTRSGINAWIRTTDVFDAFIDFDKAIRDPADTLQMRPALSNDWLHPNAEGYKVMGESIDASLFAPPPVGLRGADGSGDLRRGASKGVEAAGMLRMGGKLYRANGSTTPDR